MYLTIYKQNLPNIQTISYNNIMNNTIQNIIPENIHYYKTTIKINNPPPLNKLSMKQRTQVYTTADAIMEAYNILKPFRNNHNTQYYEFKIPKRSGGLRTINAPNWEFKNALSKVKDIFEEKIKCLAHNSAYAYTKNRSTIDALNVHKENKSNWYLKLDLKDFFPSCTPDLIYSQLKQLYPFYYLDVCPSEALREIIKICCLDNAGLPQGTPMSPILTNLIMVPYDYEINNYLKRGTGNHYAYTRYADDILISSKSDFDWKTLQTHLSGILRPFNIKDSKTRYGSKAGRNWNLGLMLNKDNKITLGHIKKKQLNAMLNNFLNDFSNNIEWPREDVYELQGQLGYLKHIEPNYFEHILNKYQDKYNTNYKVAIKTILNK